MGGSLDVALQLGVDLSVALSETAFTIMCFKDLTSCGIRPASSTQLVSLGLKILVLLKMCPYIRRATRPRSSVPLRSIWPLEEELGVSKVDRAPKGIALRWRSSKVGFSDMLTDQKPLSTNETTEESHQLTKART